MKKFGEFFDVVMTWAKDNRTEAPVYMEDWVAQVPTERWLEAREMELTEGLYQAFAEDMAGMLQQRLQGICTDALYTRVMEKGHEFLLAIVAIGTDFGVVVSTERVNVPLTPSDALMMADRSREDPD